MPSPSLLLALLLTVCFTLSTSLQPRAANWRGEGRQSDNLLALTMGDARRMFANHFFIRADVYFHSGYYPTIFNQSRTNQTHISEQAAADHDKNEKEEKEEDFLGPPKDWLEKFGRNFFTTEHTHLGGGRENEMLPWLRLSAELDPQQVEIYTVGSYWLRNNLKKPKEAEQFLREGLRANPDSFEILFELGRLREESSNDAVHARNIWEIALRKWEKTEGGKPEPDTTVYRETLLHLALSHEKAGNVSEAVSYLSRLKKISPHPDVIQKQIDELRSKVPAGNSAVPVR